MTANNNDNMDLDITNSVQTEDVWSLIDVSETAARLFATKPYYMWDEVRSEKREE